MGVTDQWLELDLSTGTHNMQSVRAFVLEENPEFSGPTSFFCIGLKEIPAGCLDIASGDHYILAEVLSESPSTLPTIGALFRGIPFESPDLKGLLQLTFCCPITMQSQKLNSQRRQICAYPVALPTSRWLAIKFGELSNAYYVVCFENAIILVCLCCRDNG